MYINLPCNLSPFLPVLHFGVGKSRFTARLGGLSLISPASLQEQLRLWMSLAGVLLSLGRATREGRLFAGSLLHDRPDAFCLCKPRFLPSPPTCSDRGSSSYFCLLSAVQHEPIGGSYPKAPTVLGGIGRSFQSIAVGLDAQIHKYHLGIISEAI